MKHALLTVRAFMCREKREQFESYPVDSTPVGPFTAARLAVVASRFPLTAWMADGAVGDVMNDGPELIKSPHEL